MEADELKAHLKTTGLLFKGVKSEISKITGKVDGIKENVDSSLGRMITKSQCDSPRPGVKGLTSTLTNTKHNRKQNLD